MKRILALLLLTALLLCPGCSTVEQAVDVLGSDEAKDMIKENWDALAGEINEGAQKAKEEVGEAIDKVLPDTKHGYTLGGAELAADTIREIEVDWVSGAVEIAVYDGDTISFSETSAGTLTEKQQLRYRLEGDELHIAFSEKGLIDPPRKSLTLQIPAALALESVEVDAVSASVDAADVQAGEIDVGTVSGHITLRNLSCRELEVESTSGQATLEDCAVADEMSIKSVSGNVVLRDLSCRDLEVESASGEATLEDCAVVDELSIKSVSGNVSVRLPAATAGFSLAFRAVSGTLQCQREVRIENGRQVNGDGSLKIEMESVSGNLSLS